MGCEIAMKNTPAEPLCGMLLPALAEQGERLVRHDVGGMMSRLTCGHPRSFTIKIGPYRLLTSCAVGGDASAAPNERLTE
jgi:hypothetical protein